MSGLPRDAVPAGRPVPTAPPGGGGLLLTAVTALVNGLGYALTVVLSRSLGPEDFGVVGALLGLILIGNVAALAVQTVSARRIAVLPHVGGQRAAEARALLAGAWRTAGIAVAVGLLAAVPLARFLHLEGPLAGAAAPLLVALVLGPLTLIGALQGIAQGEERFGLLASVLVTASLGKVGGALGGLALLSSPTGVMLGTLLGTSAAAVVSDRLVHRAGFLRTPALPARAAATHRGREVAHAAHALLALFVLQNVDVLLARHYLSAQRAGEYAVGAVIAKGAFWLPGAITLLALPRLADPSRRRAGLVAALSAMACIGVVVTVGTTVLSTTAVRLVGGAAYLDLADVAGVFALIGSLLALAQLLLVSRLAAEDRTAVLLVWAAVALLIGVVAVAANDSVAAVAGTAAVAAAALCAGSLAVEARHLAGRAGRDLGDVLG